MMDTASANRLQIERNGFGLSMTTGSSMRPLIWGGRHCVAVVPLDGAPEVGDLIMFAQPRAGREINIVHRVVEVGQDGDGPVYVTRGDNCFGTESVRQADIIGRVVEVHRTGGYRPWYAIGAKKFSVTDTAYHRYVRVWTALWPVRQLYYRLRDRLCTLRNQLRPKHRERK